MEEEAEERSEELRRAVDESAAATQGSSIVGPATAATSGDAAATSSASFAPTDVAPAAESSSSSAIGMFFTMESVVGGDGDGDDAINIIEDGDHVGADDFGLSSTDLSMNSMAPANADMTQMSMNMELNALQIQAFLARAERDASSATIMPSVVHEPTASSISDSRAEAETQAEAGASTNAVSESIQSQQYQHQKTQACGGSTSSSSTNADTTSAAAATNAYDASRDVVYYSRREDKMKKIQEHPIVDSVTNDGRQVTCKCGRVVRLNPPWYILKFEQHIVSRNCTFLRKKAKNTSSKALSKVPVVKPRNVPISTTEPAVPVPQGVNSGASENANQEVAIAEATQESREEGRSSKRLGEDGVQAAHPGLQTEEDSSASVDEGAAELQEQSSTAPSIASAHEASSHTVPDANITSQETSSLDTECEREGYALRSLYEVLASTFGMAEDGSILPPPPSSPLEVPKDHSETDGAPSTKHSQLNRHYEAAMVLQSHPHFSRITPDGRFVECTCSTLIVLTGAWEIGRFLDHVAEKNKTSSKKKGDNNNGRPTTSSKIDLLQRQGGDSKRKQRSFVLGEGASFRLKKKSFPSEIHWDVAQQRNILPCPGLRDEKMNLFVESAVHLTGGARPRHKIAQELFPHLFPAAADAADASKAGEKTKISNQLSAQEKLLLHDAIEAEARWFIDKDGSSVRSLDCRGIIDTGRGESVCAECVELRLNVSLRTAATFTAKKAKTQRNPLNRKYCSSRVFSVLEAEFNMDEEYARILRDLSLADIADDSALNMWLDMAEMGIQGVFDTHSALMGLVESMVALKDKERRGVGMQNMFYSDQLDAFMRSVADINPEACDFFQHHLCGRKQKVLQLQNGRKRKSQSSTGGGGGGVSATNPSQHALNNVTVVSDSGNEGDRSAEEMQIDDVERQHHHHHHHLLYDTSNPLGQTEGLVNLLDASNASLMPSLSINDIHDVDLSSFTTSSHVELERSDQFVGQEQPNNGDESSSAAANQHMTNGLADDDDDGDDGEKGMGGQDGAFLSQTQSEIGAPAQTPIHRVAPLEHVPCPGLRNEKVQAFVKIAVQVIGGSRPKYVIAKELFPHVFGHEKTVKIVERLDDTQKRMLQDAVFSECLWRVDKVGNCVRSLRCQRFPDKKTSKNGVCRACCDLKAVPNFRSVLSRAKTPKNLENVKYMPSTYTESDPFLRKLSKNASFRALYQLVKLKADDDKKKAVFWLKCARMGVFGNFRTHPVFEGLIESMVEVKDKERRGVGKQNMQYSKPLDDFMNAFSAISVEAFDLFASHFCGRTIRSQKVKKRKVLPTSLSVYGSVHNQTVSDLGTTMSGLHQQHQQSDFHTNIIDIQQHQHQQIGHLQHHHHLQNHHHHHHLLNTDELLGGRAITASDLEENQRFMDRMLDEVRLSVSHDIQLHEDMVERQQHRDAGDNGAALEPRTYLDEAGVLTTEI